MHRHHFTCSEYTDMHYLYGFAEGNARLASRLYAERYPNRVQPNRQVFADTHERMRQGRVAPMETNERGRSVRTLELEEMVLEEIEQNPSTSVRAIANDLGASKSTVWRVLHENLLHPFKLQKVNILANNLPIRVKT